LSATPLATASYSCGATIGTFLCSGIDEQPDCPGRNEASYWGIDTWVFGGAFAGVGGEETCTQGREGSTHERSMDVTLSYGNVYAQFLWRDVATGHPSGSTSSCTTNVTLTYALVSRAASIGCLATPLHAADLVP
jgi:hypothetical protein